MWSFYLRFREHSCFVEVQPRVADFVAKEIGAHLCDLQEGHALIEGKGLAMPLFLKHRLAELSA